MADEGFLFGGERSSRPWSRRSACDRERQGWPITRRLHSLYFDAVRGNSDAYRDWLRAVY